MSFIPIEETGHNPIPPVLRLGFRPFFLLAGIFSIIALSIWLLSYFQAFSPAVHYPPNLWHAHEMLFGYTAAVIAGFFLTAVKNWTGIQTIRGYWLTELVTVWLAARILPFLDIHPLFSAFASVSFFPFLAIAIAIPLIKAKSQANLLFIPVLLLFAVSDAIFQLAILGMIELPAMLGIQMAMHLTIILVVLMGTRVIPFFISRSTAVDLPAIPKNIDKLTYLTLILWTASSLIKGNTDLLTSFFAALAAIFQAYRLYAWHVRKLWSIPMLWILYLGFFWIFIGLFLQALNALFPMIPSIPTHALTTGSIGMITLGMMSRVSLGHTGRTINHTKIILISFILISIAPWIRVLLPVLSPQFYKEAILISGLTWIGAFILFVLVYIPILLKPRIDGRDG